MANQIVQFIQKHFRNILFRTLLSISSAVFTTISGQNLNTERDSLFNEVQKYPADTTRFLIFSNFFWQYANTDLPRVKYIGQLAFKEIKRSVIWQDTVSANPLGGTVLLDNKIIVPGNNRGLVCLDLNTGKLLSHYDRISYSTLMVADNMLYCYEDRTGKVYLFRMNGNNLELVSSFKITAGTGPRIAHMSIANGLLFIRHGKVLMAYDLKQQS